MNLNEVFKKIEMALTPNEEEVQEVQGASMRLANGVVLEAESFEAGQNVFLLGEDGEKVAAPVGEHELEDGRILVIVEEGVISEIREAAAIEAEEEEVKEEMAEEEISVEAPEEVAPEMEQIVEAVVEVMSPVLEEVKEQIEEMKRKFEELIVKDDAVEMSIDEAPAAKKVAVAPVEKKVDMNRYAKKAPQDTLSRVLSKLS